MPACARACLGHLLLDQRWRLKPQARVIQLAVKLRLFNVLDAAAEGELALCWALRRCAGCLRHATCNMQHGTWNMVSSKVLADEVRTSSA